MASYRLLSSAMRSNDDVNWHVHSLMLSFHHLCGLPLWRLPCTVSCCMIFGSVWWRQTWPNHDNLRRLTVDSQSSWRLVRILTCCHTFYAMCVLCQESSCSICFQRLGFASLDAPSTSSSQIHRAILTRQVICRVLVFVRKLIALFFFIVLPA